MQAEGVVQELAAGQARPAPLLVRGEEIAQGQQDLAGQLGVAAAVLGGVQDQLLGPGLGVDQALEPDPDQAQAQK